MGKCQVFPLGISAGLAPRAGEIKLSAVDLETESGGQWLACDGRLVEKREFPRLYSALEQYVGYPRLGPVGAILGSSGGSAESFFKVTDSVYGCVRYGSSGGSSGEIWVDYISAETGNTINSVLMTRMGPPSANQLLRCRDGLCYGVVHGSTNDSTFGGTGYTVVFVIEIKPTLSAENIHFVLDRVSNQGSVSAESFAQNLFIQAHGDVVELYAGICARRYGNVSKALHVRYDRVARSAPVIVSTAAPNMATNTVIATPWGAYAEDTSQNLYYQGYGAAAKTKVTTPLKKSPFAVCTEDTLYLRSKADGIYWTLTASTPAAIQTFDNFDGMGTILTEQAGGAFGGVGAVCVMDSVTPYDTYVGYCQDPRTGTTVPCVYSVDQEMNAVIHAGYSSDDFSGDPKPIQNTEDHQVRGLYRLETPLLYRALRPVEKIALPDFMSITSPYKAVFIKT